MPEWTSRKQAEAALKKARTEYKKAHDKLIAAIRAKKDMQTIDKLQEESDKKLAVCNSIQLVLDRYF